MNLSTECLTSRAQKHRRETFCWITSPAIFTARQLRQRSSASVGPAPAGAQRRRKNIEAFQGPHHPGFKLRISHGDRRQMDHLSPHGPGHHRSRRGSCIASQGTVAHADLRLHGWTLNPSEGTSEWARVYGSDLPLLDAIRAGDADLNTNLDAPIHPRLPYRLREVLWLRVTKMRGRSRMFWPGAPALFSSMRAPPLKLRPCGRPDGQRN